MPTKQGKYELIVRALYDANTVTFISVKTPMRLDDLFRWDQRRENVFLFPMQGVFRLTKQIQTTNRIEIENNWFWSVDLVNELAELGYWKEFQAHKHKMLVFHYMILWIIKPYPILKQNNIVVLISAIHQTNSIENHSKQPDMIQYYNSTRKNSGKTDKNFQFTQAVDEREDGLAIREIKNSRHLWQ